ncbi:DNA polymerase domain-containing protein [Paenibacillus turpanensis]|uniref:DNA polymerase domain-containing protein n=1 Tax=Paenibacillus turpanensis TaxID=2689078 RepID=UPI001408B765|nr:DNA polymerase domain-containing protein [Paenibacillus turpanensis]
MPIATPSRSKSHHQGTITVEGHELVITNPEKPLWPEKGVTKFMFLQKLIALSPYLLKYTSNRHLTTIRFPHGWNDKSFYQKNCPEPIPEFVKIAELDGIRYVNLDSLPTLLWLGNLACLEFHPSFHYIGSLEPAEWLIDIDPTLEEEPRIMEAAYLVGEILDSLGIQSVPKTSGATGVQIYVPIRKGYSFEQLRSIGKFIGDFLVAKHPSLFTIERLKKDRGDLIYFDYLQHWYGKTLSAPYTPRAKIHASVSTPLTWDEVKAGAHPKDFNLLNIEERLLQIGDLIEQVPPQSLDHLLEKLSPAGKRK